MVKGMGGLVVDGVGGGPKGLMDGRKIAHLRLVGVGHGNALGRAGNVAVPAGAEAPEDLRLGRAGSGVGPGDGGGRRVTRRGLGSRKEREARGEEDGCEAHVGWCVCVCMYYRRLVLKSVLWCCFSECV